MEIKRRLFRPSEDSDRQSSQEAGERTRVEEMLLRRETRKKKEQRRRTLMVVIPLAAALFVLGFVFLYKPDRVKAEVTVEAGQGMPPASAFLKVEGKPIAYAEDPGWIDTGAPGTYRVALKSGRYSYTSSLRIIDTTPPVIEGVEDITVAVGSSISYKDGLVVTDNASEQPALRINAEAVDLGRLGNYIVIYEAVDASGNVAQTEITVTVREKTEEEKSRDQLYLMADATLADILRPAMSDYEKLWAIFCYTTQGIAYVEDDADNETEAAIDGLAKKSGDCFTYFAVMKTLMERAGFETIDVVRDTSQKEGSHFWSLVLYEGEYYHIDATPRGPEDGREHLVFLLTDEQIAQMNEAYGLYWAYDTSLYPASGQVSPYQGEPLPEG